MLPLCERLAEAFPTEPGALQRSSFAPAAAEVRVKLDLLAVDEIRAATPQELSPQLEPPTSSNCLRGRDEIVVEKKLYIDKDRIGEKSDLCDWQRYPHLRGKRDLHPVINGPSFLLGGHQQIADRRILARYDSQGSVAPRTVPNRVLRHLERFTVATGTFPHAKVQLERQKAVGGRPGTSTASQIRRRTPRIGSEKRIRTLKWLSLWHARGRLRSRCRCSHSPDLSQPFLSGIKLHAYSKELTGDLSDKRVVEGAKVSLVLEHCKLQRDQALSSNSFKCPT